MAGVTKSGRKGQKVVFQSYVESDGTFWEQVIGNKFACCVDGELVFQEEFLGPHNEKILPCYGGELDKGHETVLLPPDSIEDYGDVQDLVEDIRAFIHEWVDFSEQFETFASWYVLLTWVYDKMPSLNYLSFLGDTGTGKSRAQDTIGRICYRTILGSGGVTVAAVKRILEKWKGTLIIDEADFKVSDETAELVKLLNLGFERNRRMYNCDKNTPDKLEFFDPFGPKLIGRRRQFTDQALEARCLTETMMQTSRTDICPVLTKKFYEQQERLRKKLFKFRFDYLKRIDIDDISVIDVGEVEPRLKQATMAFATLFMHIPGAFEQFKSFLARYQEKLIEERAETFPGEIVNKIVELLEDGQTEIAPSDIEITNSKGGTVNVRTIGKHLKQLGLETKQMRISGSKKNRKILIIDGRFWKVAKRYISDKMRIWKLQGVSFVSFVSLYRWTSPTPLLEGLKIYQNAMFRKMEEDLCNETNETRNKVEYNNEVVVEEIVDQDNVSFQNGKNDEIVHLPCFFCGSKPSQKFNNLGKPVCTSCAKHQDKLHGEDVEKKTAKKSNPFATYEE